MSLAAGLSQTRIIYEGSQAYGSAIVVNPDPYKVLVHAVIDNNTQPSSLVKIYPPIFTLPPNGRRVVKIYGLKSLINDKKESVAYINIATLPPENKQGNTVKIISNVKYKVFIRASNIAEYKISDAVNKLVVRKSEHGYVLENSSPLHIFFADLIVNGEGYNNELVKPYSSIYLGKNKPKSVSGQYIDDSGIYIPFNVEEL